MQRDEFNVALRPQRPQGRGAKDGHLEFHTAPELGSTTITREAVPDGRKDSSRSGQLSPPLKRRRKIHVVCADHGALGGRVNNKGHDKVSERVKQARSQQTSQTRLQVSE